jgi:hypothetical protein
VAAATVLGLPPGTLAANLSATGRTTSESDAGATLKSQFGYMFPDLKPFDSPTNQELADLAQGMLDPNKTSDDNPDPEMTSGYTYLGQFIDHDLTLDTTPPPTSAVDPSTLTNHRTFKFDLDHLYGGGPKVSPKLYDKDRKHLRLQDPNPNGVIDLPRKDDGSAILVDARQDENEVLSQMHVAFIKMHNRLADTMPFKQAQKTLILYYQAMVLQDFLPHNVSRTTIDSILANPDQRYYQPDGYAPYAPVEYSTAAYRFGHSQVRTGYKLNDTSGRINVFSSAGPDLRGGRNIPAGRQIDWGNFLDEFTDAKDVAHVNQSRKMDTKISKPLFVLPIPGAEATGSNVLAFRNLTRAKFYGVPSGQELAKAMGITPIPAADFGDLSPAFKNETPLWYYILGEAKMATDGQTLGPVGGRIVGETFIGILAADPDSILNQDFTPGPPIASEPGKVDIADLFAFAKVPGAVRHA